jgi:hypothetical protein
LNDDDDGLSLHPNAQTDVEQWDDDNGWLIKGVWQDGDGDYYYGYLVDDNDGYGYYCYNDVK